MASAGDVRAGSAYVQITTDMTQLERGLRQARQKLNEFGAAIKSVGTAFTVAGASITAPLLASVKVFVDTGDQLDKMSKRTGVAVESLSALGYAAKLSGAGLEDVETGIKHLQKSIVDAATGGKEANEAFAKLGISFDKLQAMAPEDQFQLVGKKLTEIQDPATRTAIALRLFGRSGTMLISLAADMKAVTAEARRMNVVVSATDASAAAELNDAYDRVKATLAAVAVQVGSALAPALTSILATIRDTVGGIAEFIRENKTLVQVVAVIGAGLAIAGGALLAFGVAASGVASAIGSLITAGKLLGSLQLGTKLLSIATALNGIRFDPIKAGASAFKAIATVAREANEGLMIGAELFLHLGSAARVGLNAIPGLIDTALKASVRGIVAFPGAVKSATAAGAGLLGKLAESGSDAINKLVLIFNAGGITGVLKAFAGRISGVVSVVIGALKGLAATSIASFGLLAAGAYGIYRIIDALLDWRKALKDAETQQKQTLELNRQLRGMDQVSGLGEFTTMESAQKSVDEYVKSLLKAGKTHEEIMKILAEKQQVEQVRADDTQGKQNFLGKRTNTEATAMAAVLDKAVNAREAYIKQIEELNQKEIQSDLEKEAQRLGLLDKAIKDRKKALEDFQKWQAEQETARKEKETEQGNKELQKSDPLQAVKQASNLYAASLKDANDKVAKAQMMLSEALKNPAADVKRNDRGEVEVINNEEVQNAIDQAKEASRIADSQKQMLTDATAAALEAQQHAAEGAKDFGKHFREIQQRRAESFGQVEFDQALAKAGSNPNRLNVLKDATKAELDAAIERAKTLRDQASQAFELAKTSGKKSDLEAAKTAGELATEAQSPVDIAVEKLKKVGEQLNVPQKFETLGTFSAANVQGIGVGSTAADRTAKASEEQVRLLAQIKSELEINSGGPFGY